MIAISTDEEEEILKEAKERALDLINRIRAKREANDKSLEGGYLYVKGEDKEEQRDN